MNRRNKRFGLVLAIVVASALAVTSGWAQRGGPPSEAGNIREIIQEIVDRVVQLETALQEEVTARSSEDVRLASDLTQEIQDRVNSDSALDADIGGLQTDVGDVRNELVGLGDSIDGSPGSFASYTDRASFDAASGGTTDVDFFEIPAGEQSFAAFPFSSGATFNNVLARNHHPPFAPFVYRAHLTHNPIRVDLPEGTLAVGAHLSSFYADPGIYTMALSTGQETTTTSASGFLGVVSERPVEWVTIRFFSECVPGVVYGTPTCPTFPTGYVPEVVVISAFTHGP